MIRRLLRILLIVAGSVVGLAVLVLLLGLLALRGSLPRLDGQVHLDGLQETVTVSRDRLGVVAIEARGRLDAARALGYVHAQDRFFQMDLQRRKAAGELAALLGPALLDSDRDTRRHRFRHRAEAVLAAADSTQRAIVQAYCEGVNAGLADLRVRPFEYLLLRRKPEPWRPADVILTLDVMSLDLSLSTAEAEKVWGEVRDLLSPGLARLLLPRGNRWEAPLQAGGVEGVVLPTAEELDRSGNASSTGDLGGPHDSSPAGATVRPPFGVGRSSSLSRHDTAGSNNWAIAGRLSAHGGAILANDMHLHLGLPNIWYRVQMSWRDGDRPRRIVGVSLPGAPLVVVGSNGQVAWGFTNSNGDWADLVILETDPADSARYRTPDGWKRMERITEIIEVAGAAADTLWVRGTIWGPVWTRDLAGRPMALRWTAHDPQAVNLNLLKLETAATVDEVVELAPTVGIPQQNLVCADRGGHIGWTIAGAIPRRVGWDGRLPVSWADGRHRWDGYRDPSRQSKVIDPEEGRLWTANNRVVAGEDLRAIGDGGYALGVRARQIRDDLRALDQPGEEDLLAVQLDDRAVFMAQWRDLVLEVLRRRPPAGDGPRQRFLQVVRDAWTGRAEVESVAYRLVREFSSSCVDGIYRWLTAPCRRADPSFRSWWLPYRHAVAWKLLTERPEWLLPPGYRDWDAFMLEAVDRVMAEATAGGSPVEEYTWGGANRVDIFHPFVHLMPSLRRWLAAPVRPLPGDSFMPRVQHPHSGASERLVVSPGREEDGLFHMPGGQSGHPLSPFFLAGHRAWEEGAATPLLPGLSTHRLELSGR